MSYTIENCDVCCSGDNCPDTCETGYLCILSNCSGWHESEIILPPTTPNLIWSNDSINGVPYIIECDGLLYNGYFTVVKDTTQECAFYVNLKIEDELGQCNFGPVYFTNEQLSPQPLKLTATFPIDPVSPSGSYGAGCNCISNLGCSLDLTFMCDYCHDDVFSTGCCTGENVCSVLLLSVVSPECPGMDFEIEVSGGFSDPENGHWKTIEATDYCIPAAVCSGINRTSDFFDCPDGTIAGNFNVYCTPTGHYMSFQYNFAMENDEVLDFCTLISYNVELEKISCNQFLLQGNALMTDTAPPCECYNSCPVIITITEGSGCR
jgi:hypothetical protein